MSTTQAHFLTVIVRMKVSIPILPLNLVITLMLQMIILDLRLMVEEIYFYWMMWLNPKKNCWTRLPAKRYCWCCHERNRTEHWVSNTSVSVSFQSKEEQLLKQQKEVKVWLSWRYHWVCKEKIFCPWLCDNKKGMYSSES